MRTVVVICTIAASVFIGSSAWAGLVLDQHQENQGYINDDIPPKYVGYSYGVGYSTMMAQTFTAGVTGDLAYIQIGNTSGASYDPMSAPVVEIRNTQGGQPGSTILGSINLDYTVPTNGWTPLIPFNISITKDQMYAIVLYADGYTGVVSVGAIGTENPEPSPSEDPLNWLYPDRTLPWLYPGGDLWGNFDGSSWLLLSGGDGPAYDMQFRTYVQAVPLPAGVWLGIFAVSVVGWHLKRQRG